jgi:hypothetical protein
MDLPVLAVGQDVRDHCIHELRRRCVVQGPPKDTRGRWIDARQPRVVAGKSASEQEIRPDAAPHARLRVTRARSKSDGVPAHPLTRYSTFRRRVRRAAELPVQQHRADAAEAEPQDRGVPGGRRRGGTAGVAQGQALRPPTAPLSAGHRHDADRRHHELCRVCAAGAGPRVRHGREWQGPSWSGPCCTGRASSCEAPPPLSRQCHCTQTPQREGDGSSLLPRLAATSPPRPGLASTPARRPSRSCGRRCCRGPA